MSGGDCGTPAPRAKRYRLAIFDFDGTLADSFDFFVATFNTLAARHGFRPVTPEEIASLRRHDARLVMRHVGLPAWKLPRVAKDFVGMMRSRREAIRPFPGIAALLCDLERCGVQVAVVSSNDRDNVIGVLGAAAAAAVRHLACGMSIFGKRAHLRKVLRRAGVPAEAALYIGDQATDLEAAHAEGIAFGAVAWGYGEADELKRLGADHAFPDVDAIRSLLVCRQASPDAAYPAQ